MLSLGVSLVFTLPVILYPSTEMLEVWLDERNDERHRKMEAVAYIMLNQPGFDDSPKPFWDKQKSLLSDDDETVYTVTDQISPRPMGIGHFDIEMRDLSSPTTGAGEYVAPSCSSQEPSPMNLESNDINSTSTASVRISPINQTWI